MPHSTLDKKDEEILNILKDDGRASFVKIARLVGLSEAAVRRRVQNLIKRGVIKRFTTEIDTGRGVNAISLISVAPSTPTHDVSEKLRKLKGVEVVYEITGQYDIAVIISASNIAEINQCIDDIRKVEGVANTNSIIILRVVR
ncbi:MAG: HTH-type transcriptional regulator LysM [Nitrososphaerota archaeon]|nr:HTH-type transcriptional regulator LysM [Nitrososphaerales archaeon]MDW8044524.1 HTH-type transcriptional regulator LysM [Nitrososphaerota archaeon]